MRVKNINNQPINFKAQEAQIFKVPKAMQAVQNQQTTQNNDTLQITQIDNKAQTINKEQPAQAITNQKPEQTAKFNNKKFGLIDALLDKVKNPSDVNDCVSVPRGIFKAYICLMTGSGLLSIAGLIPKRLKAIKTPIAIAGSVLHIFSAFFFAKPFIMKDLSPTVKKEDSNQNQKV